MSILGKEEIQNFKRKTKLREIKEADWMIVKTKVFNEKMTLGKKIKNNLK